MKIQSLSKIKRVLKNIASLRRLNFNIEITQMSAIVKQAQEKMSQMHESAAQMDERITQINEKNIALDAMCNYYFYEISNLREKMRYLIANNSANIPRKKATDESFDYQWEHLNSGYHLLDDESFTTQVTDFISSYTLLDKKWFTGKKVLDAGCGQGRFSYGFGLLDVDLVAVDQSENAVKKTLEIMKKINKNVHAYQHDLLFSLPEERDFDLVWSYGVLHHTGDTFKAFKNIAALVKPNGYIFLMLYGEPQRDNVSSFQEQAEYSRLRSLTRNMDFKEKVDFLLCEKPKEHLHGWFDAISPHQNDTYSLQELKMWLTEEGFQDIQITSPSTNYHIIARKIN